MEKGARQANDESRELCIMKETIAKRLSQPARWLANLNACKKGAEVDEGLDAECVVFPYMSNQALLCR